MNNRIKTVVLTAGLVCAMGYYTTSTAMPIISFNIKNLTPLTVKFAKVGDQCVHKGRYMIPSSLKQQEKGTFWYDDDSHGCTGASYLEVGLTASPRDPGYPDCTIKLTRGGIDIGSCQNVYDITGPTSAGVYYLNPIAP